MKYRLATMCGAALLMAACAGTPKEPSRDELAATIDSLERPLMDNSRALAVDTAKGREIIDLYLHFADSYPADTLAPHYLHQAARVACGMGLIDEMSQSYNRVIENYPTYDNIAECYYEMGLALDNAGRKEEARKVYEEFLEEFPDHFLANDIRNSLPLLDLSDKMLIEHLQNMDHQQN